MEWNKKRKKSALDEALSMMRGRDEEEENDTLSDLHKLLDEKEKDYEEEKQEIKKQKMAHKGDDKDEVDIFQFKLLQNLKKSKEDREHVRNERRKTMSIYDLMMDSDSEDEMAFSDEEAIEDNSYNLDGTKKQNYVPPGAKNDAQKPKPVEIPPHLHKKLMINHDTMLYAHLIANSSRLPTSGKGRAANQEEEYGADVQAYGPEISPFIKPYVGNNENLENVITVIMDMDHPTFGLEGQCKSNKYGSPMRNGKSWPLEDVVFKGLPVKSPLYKYQLTVTRNRYLKDHQKNYFRVQEWDVARCTLIKRGIGRNNIHYFCKYVLGLEDEYEDLFIQVLKGIFPDYETRPVFLGHETFKTVMRAYEETDSVRTFREREMEKEIQELEKSAFAKGKRFDRSHYKVKPFNETSYFANRPELIRYIYCEEYNKLKDYYEDRVILNMTPHQMLEISNLIDNNPYELFFFRKTHYVYQYVANTGKGKDVRISEAELTGFANPDYSEDSEELANEEFVKQIRFSMDIVKNKILSVDQKNITYVLYLPELTDMHLKLMGQTNMTREEEICVKIYHNLKRSYKNKKHAFEYRSNLMPLVGLRDGDDGDTKLFDKCVTTLINTLLYTDPSAPCNWAQELYSNYRPTILNRIGTHVYTRESYLNTKTIIECLQVLVDRYVRGTAHMPLVYDENDKDKDRDIDESIAKDIQREKCHIKQAVPNITNEILQGLVSEQKHGLGIHEVAPIMLIEGGAGSGKTTELKRIIQCYKPGEVLACAFQGRNVASLASVLGRFCYTCHYLINLHKRMCVTERYNFQQDVENSGTDVFCSEESNAASDKARRMAYWRNKKIMEKMSELKEAGGIFFKRCPFEDFKVLIIDEMSLMDEELLALILSQVLRCGHITKVVFCGDPRQLPSLGSGDALAGIKKFCDDIGTTVSFKECHRVDAGSRLIFRNCQAVAARRPQDVELDGKCVCLEEVEIKRTTTENLEHGRTVMSILKKHDIPEDEHMTITYANIVRRSVINVIDNYYRGEEPSDEMVRKTRNQYFSGRRIIYNSNRYGSDEKETMINNEPLKIIRIEDVQSSKRTNTKGKKKDQLLDLMDLENEITEGNNDDGEIKTVPTKIIEVETTAAPYSFKGCERRLVVKSLENISNNKEEKYIPWNKIHRRHIVKNYCVTAYAAQGGEFDTIIHYMPYCSSRWTNRAIYTVWSRAKKKLILLGEYQWFKRAIMTEDEERYTEFGDLAIDECAWRLRSGWKRWKLSPKFESIKDCEEMFDASMFEEIEKDNQELEKKFKPFDFGQCKDAWKLVFLSMIKSDPHELGRILKYCRINKTILHLIRDDPVFWSELYALVYSLCKSNDYMLTPNEFVLACNKQNANVYFLFLKNLGETIYMCNHKKEEKRLISFGYIVQVMYNSISRKGEPKTNDPLTLDLSNEHRKSFGIQPVLPLCESNKSLSYTCYIHWTRKATMANGPIKDLKEYTDKKRIIREFNVDGFIPLTASIDKTGSVSKYTVNIKLGFIRKLAEEKNKKIKEEAKRIKDEEEAEKRRKLHSEEMAKAQELKVKKQLKNKKNMVFDLTF